MQVDHRQHGSQEQIKGRLAFQKMPANYGDVRIKPMLTGFKVILKNIGFDGGLKHLHVGFEVKLKDELVGFEGWLKNVFIGQTCAFY